jgi:hypothetical protein
MKVFNASETQGNNKKWKLYMLHWGIQK